MSSQTVVGTWGVHLTFTVGLDKILTFETLSQSVESRWAEHNILGSTPRLEWLGPALQEVELRNVLLSVGMGVKVRKVLENIERHARLGTHAPLYIGGKKMCRNDMVLAFDEEWRRFYSGGEPTHVNLTLRFREYYER